MCFNILDVISIGDFYFLTLFVPVMSRLITSITGMIRMNFLFLASKIIVSIDFFVALCMKWCKIYHLDSYILRVLYSLGAS